MWGGEADGQCLQDEKVVGGVDSAHLITLTAVILQCSGSWQGPALEVGQSQGVRNDSAVLCCVILANISHPFHIFRVALTVP